MRRRTENTIKPIVFQRFSPKNFCNFLQKFCKFFWRPAVVGPVNSFKSSIRHSALRFNTARTHGGVRRTTTTIQNASRTPADPFCNYGVCLPGDWQLSTRHDTRHSTLSPTQRMQCALCEVHADVIRTERVGCSQWSATAETNNIDQERFEMMIVMTNDR